MAITQYQIFCRYLNDTVNRALSNKTKIEWISAEDFLELKKFENTEITKYIKITEEILKGKKITQLNSQELKIYNTGKKYDEVMAKIENGKMVQEYCIVEPADSLSGSASSQYNQYKKEQSERDLELYNIVIQESRATNPKYDMVFMYDGIGYAESRTGEADYHPPLNDDKQVPYLYYERMKRIKLDPWFLFSTHASLTSAMIKARELVNIFGKDAVKIGKVVPLDQYIEIV